MTYVIALPCVDIKDNARFFAESLPGLDAPLGSPGGAAKLGVTAADTPLVHGLPPHPMEGQDDE